MRIEVIRYLGGWRIDEDRCWIEYDKLNNEELNKVIDNESNWLYKSKYCCAKRERE